MSEPGIAVPRAANYRHVRPLASGGMGQVDLAVRRDENFLRLYAIKRLHAHVRDDADLRAMFLEEARIAGLIRHPNVVSVVDFGDDAEGPFLVMDYVEGVSVGTIIERSVETGRLLPLEVALRIGIHAALGLHAAHDLKAPDGSPLSLVHRDISPGNILVGFDGIARVTDFGIAKAVGRAARTSTGILKGKLGYMSPEQLQFRACDRRSDLFSLGVVLFELLTSSRLYPGKLGEESARRILDEPPPDLLDFRDDAPPELVGLLFRLLAKSPDSRPSDARVVARKLETILHDLVASEASTDTTDHLEREFGAERRAEELRTAVTLAALETAPESARGEHDSRLGPRGRVKRRALMGMTGAALAIAIGTWMFSSLRRSEATPEPAASIRPFSQASLAAAEKGVSGGPAREPGTVAAEEAPEQPKDPRRQASRAPGSSGSSAPRSKADSSRDRGSSSARVRLWDWQ